MRVKRKVLGGLCLLLIVIIALVLVLSATGQKQNRTLRSDLEPIVKRYPNISGIESAAWLSDSFGGTDFGMTSYWMEGFIKLKSPLPEQDTLKDWVAVTNLEPLHFAPEEMTAYGSNWLESNTFNQKYESAEMFFTKFCYCFETQTLYFYAETN